MVHFRDCTNGESNLDRINTPHNKCSIDHFSQLPSLQVNLSPDEFSLECHTQMTDLLDICITRLTFTILWLCLFKMHLLFDLHCCRESPWFRYLSLCLSTVTTAPGVQLSFQKPIIQLRLRRLDEAILPEGFQVKGLQEWPVHYTGPQSTFFPWPEVNPLVKQIRQSMIKATEPGTSFQKVPNLVKHAVVFEKVSSCVQQIII